MDGEDGGGNDTSMRKEAEDGEAEAAEERGQEDGEGEAGMSRTRACAAEPDAPVGAEPPRAVLPCGGRTPLAG